MTLSISDSLVTSDVTDHQAAKVTRAGVWSCTWCPDKELNANQAETAMKLAEEIDQGRDGLDGNFSAHRWRQIKKLANELGIPALRAVHLIEGTEGQK